MVDYLSTDDMNLKRSAVRALHQLAKNADSCIKMHDKGVVKVRVHAWYNVFYFWINEGT